MSRERTRRGSGGGACLLLVDDDPASSLLARIAVEESELEASLLTASGVQEAAGVLWAGLHQPGERLPDLVLLDLNLRDGSGHDLLAFLKMDPDLRNIPVVILSTSSNPADIRRAIEQGAARYLVKPSDFGKLVEAVGGLRELLQ